MDDFRHAELTGASNATFVVGLSLVSGNVGGQTKKALASASIFLGVAAGWVFMYHQMPVNNRHWWFAFPATSWAPFCSRILRLRYISLELLAALSHGPLRYKNHSVFSSIIYLSCMNADCNNFDSPLHICHFQQTSGSCGRRREGRLRRAYLCARGYLWLEKPSVPLCYCESDLLSAISQSLLPFAPQPSHPFCSID